MSWYRIGVQLNYSWINLTVIITSHVLQFFAEHLEMEHMRYVDESLKMLFNETWQSQPLYLNGFFFIFQNIWKKIPFLHVWTIF
jgi:hypothetical protein